MSLLAGSSAVAVSISTEQLALFHMCRMMHAICTCPTSEGCPLSRIPRLSGLWKTPEHTSSHRQKGLQCSGSSHGSLRVSTFLVACSEKHCHVAVRTLASVLLLIMELLYSGHVVTLALSLLLRDVVVQEAL